MRTGEGLSQFQMKPDLGWQLRPQRANAAQNPFVWRPHTQTVPGHAVVEYFIYNFKSLVVFRGDSSAYGANPYGHAAVTVTEPS